MKSHLMGVFFGVRDYPAFNQGLQNLINQVDPVGVFVGDNLFTFNRNLGFLDDERFMSAFNTHAENATEQSTIWRTYTQCWAANRTMALDGDMMECACYRGTSARIVADYVDLKSTDKNFYLYDLFEHDESMPHEAMPEHGVELYDVVKQRFAGIDNAHVTKGKVPEILHQIAPEKIAYLHLDLNNTEAEMGALEFLFERVVPGGSVIFDDYGWAFFHAQKAAEDEYLAQLGYQILELPTGQGLLIK
jgi:hypothetical protein